MKLLLSAYACEPNKGSEPGVGWEWAREISRLGHEVWVLTRENNRASIETALGNSTANENLHFVYFDLPSWARWWKKGERGIHLYYLLWQWGAYRLAKKIHRRERFERVHHITFVSMRQPSFMGNLGIPFIFGPASGGEHAPWNLRKSYSWRDWIWDGLRDISNMLISLDPLMRRTFRQADHIYVTSSWNRSLIPPKYRDKVSVMLAIGFNSEEMPGLTEPHPKNTSNRDMFKVLYVGNLLYVKGMHLGIPAFARFLKEMPSARLTMVGSGPNEHQWKTIAESLGVEDHIDWIPKQDRRKLSELYATHDVFLYPSLHDSGGIVILEAFAHKLPVACLDLWGAGIMVNETCGLKVKTEGLDEEQVICELADRLALLANDPEQLHRLSEGAVNRAEEFRWSTVVGQVYQELNGTAK